MKRMEGVGWTAPTHKGVRRAVTTDAYELLLAFRKPSRKRARQRSYFSSDPWLHGEVTSLIKELNQISIW